MRRGYVQLSLSFLIWSSWVIPIRYLGESPFTFGFFNALYATVIWGCILAYKYRRYFIIDRESAGKVLVLSLFFCLNTLTYFGSLQYTTASIAVLTHYTAPVFVAVLAPFFLKERLTRRALISLGVALAGFLVLFSKVEGTGRNFPLGVSLGLASGLFYALIVIFSKKTLLSVHETTLLFYQNLFGTVLLLVFLPYINFGASPVFYTSFFGLAILYSGAASLLYLIGLKKLGGIRTAITGYLEPLGTILWGWLFFNEAVTVRTIIGGILILYSGYHITKE